MSVWVLQCRCGYFNVRMDTSMSVWILQCQYGFFNVSIVTSMSVWLLQCQCGYFNVACTSYVWFVCIHAVTPSLFYTVGCPIIKYGVFKFRYSTSFLPDLHSGANFCGYCNIDDF
ncbi:unnamed protein product [Discosporangium mesarthrocarpum]